MHRKSKTVKYKKFKRGVVLNQRLDHLSVFVWYVDFIYWFKTPRRSAFSNKITLAFQCQIIHQYKWSIKHQVAVLCNWTPPVSKMAGNIISVSSGITTLAKAYSTQLYSMYSTLSLFVSWSWSWLCWLFSSKMASHRSEVRNSHFLCNVICVSTVQFMFAVWTWWCTVDHF